MTIKHSILPILLCIFSFGTIHAQYCESMATTCEATTRIVINSESGGLDFRSGCNPYSDHTDQIAYLLPTGTYQIDIYGNAPGVFAMRSAAYIDWNQNDTFDVDELIGEASAFSQFGGVPTSFPIVPPVGIALGSYRIRVLSGTILEAPFPPCGPVGRGEVEDYTLEITDNPPPPPPPGPVTYCDGFATICEATTRVTINSESGGVDNNSDCEEYSDFTDIIAFVLPDGAYQIDVYGNAPGVIAMTTTAFVDWNDNKVFEQSEILGTGSSIPQFQGVPSSFPLVVPPGTSFGPKRLRIVSGTTATTDGCGDAGRGEVEDYTVEVTTTPPPTTYCIPQGEQACDAWISNFTVDGQFSNTTGCDVYGDFSTSHVITASPGDNIPLSGTGGGFTDTQITGWVDWNQNGIFEEAERLAFSGVTAAGYAGTLNVPTDAPTGHTRLRLKQWYAVLSDNTNSCGNASGEFEDYGVVIGNLPDCVEQLSPLAVNLTNEVKCDADTALIWSKSTDIATGYNIYLGNQKPPKLIATQAIDDTTFTLPSLAPDTTFYWMVIPFTADGEAFGCTIDSFITPSNTDPIVDITPDGSPLNLCPFIPQQLNGQPQNGTSPVTYSWTGDVDPLSNTTIEDPIFEASNAGIYELIFTATDSNDCFAIDTLAIRVFDADEVVIEPVALVCFHDDTLTLNAEPKNGVWRGSGIVDSMNGLFFAPAADTGLHEITYTAGNVNCTLHDTIYIRVSRPDSVSIDDLDTFCASQDNVFFGGFPTDAIWSGTGIVDSLTGEFSPAEANPGLHRIILTATDDLGCEAYDTATAKVTGDDPKIVPVDPICDSDGPFNLVASTPGGRWEGPCISNNNAGTFDPKICGPGTFKVVYKTTDNFFCEASDSIFVVISDGPSVEAGTDFSLCDTGRVMIGGHPTVEGGNQPYNFLWEPRVGVNNDRIANPVAAPSETTQFTVTVTDNAGCVGSDSMTVVILPQSFFVNAGDNNEICQGESAILGATPPTQGALEPIQYFWSPSSSINIDTVPNPAATPSSTTSYTLTVTDATGCTYTDSVSIAVNDNPVAHAGNNQTICALDSTSIGSNSAATGGVAPYEYTWQPSTERLTGKQPRVSPINTTIYTLTVTDKNGCSAVDEVTVVVQPTVHADAGIDASVCIGTSVQIGGSPSGSNGTLPFTYSWFSDFNISDSKASNPIVQIDTIQSYILLVSDANGCTDADTINFDVLPQPKADAGADQLICETGSIVLGGAPTAQDGVGDYTYSWKPIKELSIATLPNPTSSLKSSTQYTVTVTDANKCESTDSVYITVIEALELDIDGLQSGYCLDSKPEKLLGQPAGGIFYGIGIINSETITEEYNGAAVNLKDNGATTVSFSTSKLDNQSLGNNLSLASVSIFIEHPNVSDLKIFLQNPAGNRVKLIDRIGIPNTTQGCTGSNIDATFITGAFSPNTAELACGETTPAITGVFRSMDNLHLLNDGTNGQGLWKLIIEDESPSATGILVDWSMTFGQPTQFDPTIVRPGEHLIEYSYTDKFGCISSIVQEISISDIAILNAGLDKGLCEGDSAQLGGTPTIIGGTAPYRYNWLPATGLSHTSTANPSAAPTEPTTYTLTATDANGCVAVTEKGTTEATTSITGNAPSPRAGFDFVVDGNKVEFYSNSSADVAFWLWDFDNGQFSGIPNPIIEFDKTASFNVCLTVTNTFQCEHNMCRDIKMEFTSITEFDKQNNLTVYPNPVNEVLFIDNKHSFPIEFTIFDIAGNKVSSSKVGSKEVLNVSVSNLAPGSYLVKYRLAQENKEHQFIKF